MNHEMWNLVLTTHGNKKYGYQCQSDQNYGTLRFCSYNPRSLAQLTSGPRQLYIKYFHVRFSSILCSC